MFHKSSKGIATIIAINIFLVFAAISLFIFLSLFTYTITIARIQTVSKSRDSLIPLVVMNLRYLDNNNLAIALAINKQLAQDEITNKIETITGKCDSDSEITCVLCYSYEIKNFVSSHIFCDYGKEKYTFRTVFPFPQIFDGNNFVTEGVFESYTTR